MIPIALIRHGPTDWNAEHRLQGRADRPLSDEGRAKVSGWKVPAAYKSYDWVASPLSRAQQTAELLALNILRLEPGIVEMDWGDWEGHTRTELDEIYGDEVSKRAALGLDLRPHNGESPRDVRDRVADWARTIANSGTQKFMQSLSGDAQKDSQLIGQFGVGFYSSFIVAHKVEVTTRRAGLKREEGVRWVAEGKNDYTLESVDWLQRGTQIVLHLRDEADEVLNAYRLRSIVNKYSDHISLPIVMDKDIEGEEGTEPTVEEETVNSATALWTRSKRSIKKAEYEEVD